MSEKRNIRDHKRRLLAAKYELRRKLYKAFCKDPDLPRRIPSFHRREILRRSPKGDQLVKFYLSVFSISKLIKLAKPVGVNFPEHPLSPPKGWDHVWQYKQNLKLDLVKRSSSGIGRSLCQDCPSNLSLGGPQPIRLPQTGSFIERSYRSLSSRSGSRSLFHYTWR
ncbi:hypothetical protein Leryth_025674 [Lithospermum erythrorhizon]|nr:hypothetical protein Leryth_025674 [Lithospermum erythrorhizon]